MDIFNFSWRDQKVIKGIKYSDQINSKKNLKRRKIMDNVVASFENFIEEFSKCGYDISTQDLDNETKFLIGRIWDNTLSFLEDTKLVSSHESLNDLNSKISTVGMDLQDVGHQEIISYVRSCNVPESYVVPCAKAVALCIQFQWGHDITVVETLEYPYFILFYF